MALEEILERLLQGVQSEGIIVSDEGVRLNLNGCRIKVDYPNGDTESWIIPADSPPS